MNKLLSVLRFFSIAAYLIVFLFVYANLPQQVNLFFLENTPGKNQFFYSVLTVFVIINIAFSLLSAVYKNLGEVKATSKRLLRTWMLSLPVMFNFYLVFMIAYIGVLNADGMNPRSYAYLIYLGPILVVTWIGILVGILAQGLTSEKRKREVSA